MYLILGGKASGKYEYLRSLGYEPEQIATGVLDGKPALYGLEELVFRDVSSAEALFDAVKVKEAVVCCEVGSGVIPVTGQQRAAREATGRLCIRLAKEAEAVIRLVAGIPVVIKGNIL